MRKLLVLFLVVFSWTLRAEAIAVVEDPRIIHGTLENGLQYYVCPSDYPKGEACLRLVVKAGSIYERDHEKGIAHFVEHMVFRGSDKLADGEVFKYLESIGAWPGADTNAYTGCEATVYMINLPTVQMESLEKAVVMLDEMAFHATLPDALIEKERTVILDELYHSFGSATIRFNQAIINQIAKDSAYEDHLPAGHPEIVQNCSPDVIRKFYRRWYRPDRMAIVAVGDFNASAVQSKIVEIFSKESSQGKAPMTPSIRIDFPDEPQALVYHDDALTGTVVTVLHPYMTEISSGEIEEESEEKATLGIGNSLFQQIMQRRIAELSDKYPDLFLYCWFDNSSVTEYLSFFQVGAVCFEDRLEDALSMLNTEMRRMQKWGASSTELQQARLEMQGALALATENPELFDHESTVQTCIDHFLLGSPMLDVKASFADYERILEQVTLEDVNFGLDDEEDDVYGECLIVLRTPSKKTAADFSAERLLAIFLQEQEADRLSEVQEEPEFLFPFVGVEGEIVEEKIDPETGVFFWTLSNGMKVAYKQTGLIRNEVILYGFAEGGYNLVSPKEYHSALFAVPYFFDSGLANLSLPSYRQFVASRQIGLDFAVQTGKRTISLFVPQKSLECGFQLVHTAFVERKFDPARFDILVNRHRELDQYRAGDPKNAFSDFVNQTNFQGHYLFQPLCSDFLDEELARVSYDRFFSNPADFLFVLSGDVQEQDARHLVTTYLASIPSQGTREEVEQALYDFPGRIIEEHFRYGMQQGSETLITYPFDYEAALQQCGHGICLTAAAMVLEQRLEAVLREEMGDSYGVKVYFDYPYSPSRKGALVKIHFTSHSVEVDPMTAAVFAQIEKLQKASPREQEVAVVAGLLRSAGGSEETNWGWIRDIVASVNTGETVADIREIENMIGELNPDSIQAAAQVLFRGPSYTVLSHLPEK